MKNRIALQISLIYFFTGSLWILFSDQFILSRAGSGNSITVLQTYKGWFFIGITAILLFLLIRKEIITKSEIEQNLIKAKLKAEVSDRLKSAFLSNMSHEVRTPLNSIIGFSELLTDADFDEDQKKKFTQQIIRNGNNLLSIISDILDISKLESGEIKIRKIKINAQKFISNMMEQFLLQTDRNKHKLIVTFPKNSENVFVFADVDRLMQVFNNLVANAIKFTPNGSIEIGYQPKGQMVEFYVKDTGIGISDEYRNKIFEHFMQVEADSTRKYGGNGLGLAISKNLIEQMGGEIWVESTFGEGSTFYFTLPEFKGKKIQYLG